MLVFPEGGSKEVRIASIDPGTNNLGFCVITVDVTNMSIVSTMATTFISDKLLTNDEFLSDTHSERMCKLIAQKNNLIKMFRLYKVDYICCESPFFNRFRPTAFGPLMEIVSAIQLAAIEYNPLIKFTLYPPSIIKKSLGGGGLANKESIRQQLLLRNDLKFTGPYKIDTLDEHSFDAIAIGLCHYELMKKGYVTWDF